MRLKGGKGPIAKKGFNHLPLSPLIKYLKGLFWSERKKCNCSDGSKASLAEKKLTGLGSALIKDRKGVFKAFILCTLTFYRTHNLATMLPSDYLTKCKQALD